MTKAEVVRLLCEKVGLPHKQGVEAVETFLESIKTSLKEGDKVSLVGFGTFYVKERKARNGRNPRTGGSIDIPSKRVASFKPGKALRDLIMSLEDVEPAKKAE